MKIVTLQFPHVMHDLMNRLNFGKLLNFPKIFFRKILPSVSQLQAKNLMRVENKATWMKYLSHLKLIIKNDAGQKVHIWDFSYLGFFWSILFRIRTECGDLRENQT